MSITVSVGEQALSWVLGSICRINQIPFDSALPNRHFPPPYTVERLLHALKAYGFQAELRTVTRGDLERLVFPCVGLARAREDARRPQTVAEGVQAVSGSDLPDPPAAAPVESAPMPRSLALLIKADGERVLFFGPEDETPKIIPVEEFDTRFEPFVIFFAKAPEAVKDHDVAQEQKSFGFRWFIPELLKHKKIWREVLAASLVIQLLALATPLFTQVVVDKVVGHHTRSTLVVIAVALFFAMAFSAGMSWIRQYLVLHTGNRVDAMLGTQVFEHLFRLPTRYFEHRSTGVLVARLHGVETIREFITGAAVTLFLDMPFLVIFLAIMFYYRSYLEVTWGIDKLFTTRRRSDFADA
jgi:subfamily B ATP-binding cassette protein HlyB/CyaB